MPEPAEGQTTSELLAASLPDPPTTEPKYVHEPMAKKQKVTASSDVTEENQASNDDQFEGFPDDKSHNESPPAVLKQDIEEGWEDVAKDEDLVNADPDMALDEELVQVEGIKDKKTKVLGADDEVDSQAPSVPNMLTKDW